MPEGIVPDCPECGLPILVVTQGGINTDTGKAHLCAIAFFSAVGQEAVEEAMAHAEAQYASAQRERAQAEDAEQATKTLADELSKVSTLEDLLGQ